jgi:hypothetical protein
MTDAFNKGIARWENEGGALHDIVCQDRSSSAYFRERRAHCRNQANECCRSGMRSTYLGFAARYAALAQYLETGNGETKIRLTIV